MYKKQNKDLMFFQRVKSRNVEVSLLVNTLGKG